MIARCTWDEADNADGYNVYLKSNGEFIKQNTELITGTQYDIEDLGAGEYEAYATSVRGEVESEPSNMVSFVVGTLASNLSSLNFNGQSHIDTNIPSHFGNHNQLSVLFYFQMNESAATNVTQSLLGRIGSGDRLYVDMASGNFRIGFGNQFQNATGWTVQFYRVNYCALCMDRAAGTATFYVNGKPLTTFTGNSGQITADDFWIAMRDGINELDGIMDEIAVFNRELSDQEVNDYLFDPSVVRSDPALIHIWPFDEESATEVLDDITQTPATVIGTPSVEQPIFTDINRKKKRALYTDEQGHLNTGLLCNQIVGSGNVSFVIRHRWAGVRVTATMFGTIGSGGTRLYFDYANTRLRLAIGDDFWELDYNVSIDKWFTAYVLIEPTVASVYVDNVLIDQRSWGGDIAAWPFLINTRSTTASGGTSTTLQARGSTAELAIFDKILSEEDRDRLMWNYVDPANPDLKHYWDFETRVPGGYKDLVGNGDAMEVGHVFQSLELPRLNKQYIGRSEVHKFDDGLTMAQITVPSDIQPGDRMFCVCMRRTEVVQTDGFVFVDEVAAGHPDWGHQKIQVFSRVYQQEDPLTYTFEIEGGQGGHAATFVIVVIRPEPGATVEVQNMESLIDTNNIAPVRAVSEDTLVMSITSPVSSTTTASYTWPVDFEQITPETHPAHRLSIGLRKHLTHLTSVSGTIGGEVQGLGSAKLSLALNTDV